MVNRYWPEMVKAIGVSNCKMANQLSPFRHFTISLFLQGGIDWNRTSDTRIFSPLLYQLSYDAGLGLQN